MLKSSIAVLRQWLIVQSLVLCAHAQGLMVGQGVFADRDGGTHRWQITPAHSLQWDGQVYLPVGVWFTPQFLRADATEADFQRDAQLLDALARAGVNDIYIVPRDAATAIPAERWQRIVDALESRNLRYGISLGEVGLPVAQGYVVAPASNRIANIAQSGVVVFRAPYADHALTFIVDTHDNSILSHSRVNVEQGVGRLPLQLQEGVLAVMVAYPHRPLVDAGGFVPDVWEGYDAWRDGVLQTLGKVRFGKGLRFFTDPLGRWTLPLEDDGIVPSSEMFRLGFEAFLSRKYQTLENLMSAWALSERNLESFADAARQLPLWRGQKGIPQLLDLQTGNLRRVEAARCSYWKDINQYRREVLQEAADRMAAVLKRHIADVPVLLSWQRFHPVYVSTQNQPGVDGLLVVTAEHGANLAIKSMAPAMGQATECVRPTWLLTSLTHDVRQGYADSQTLHSEAETLAQAGGRGWFWRVTESTVDATALQWLRSFQQSVLARAEWQQPSKVLFFPLAALGICEVKRLPGDVWWLPSARPGSIVNVGQNYRAYQLSTLGGEQYVMWAVDRDRPTKFRLTEPRVLTAQLPDGTPVKIGGKGRNFSIKLPTVPVVFTNSGTLFPVEAAEDAINELARLIKLGEARRTDVGTARFRWQQARDNLRAGQVYTAYLLASEALNELIQRLAQYLWMEAETADESNFDEVVEQPWASGGKLVRLQNFNDPPARGYFLRYRFAVKEEGNYTLWVACRPEGSSPLLWSIDDNAPQPPESSVLVGEYGEGFGWIRMGTVRLSPGFHNLELRVVNRAGEGVKPYVQWCDVVLLSAENIIPQGTTKPPVR
ncbi:MAG: hypothetical protein KatS3mg022_0029 [Armatimonadota bacterium]|nr:MAG: hypothetical protein KatS3mg022_0029 [Armatimonadota bacterium]